MDEGNEVHADQPEVGGGLGDQQVHKDGVEAGAGAGTKGNMAICDKWCQEIGNIFCDISWFPQQQLVR